MHSGTHSIIRWSGATEPNLPVQPHLPLWEGLGLVYRYDPYRYHQVGKIMRARYLGPVGGDNLGRWLCYCARIPTGTVWLATMVVGVWRTQWLPRTWPEGYVGDTVKVSYGRQVSLKQHRSTRKGSVRKYGTRSFIVWVKCANSAELKSIRIAASSVMDSSY